MSKPSKKTKMKVSKVVKQLKNGHKYKNNTKKTNL